MTRTAEPTTVNRIETLKNNSDRLIQWSKNQLEFDDFYLLLRSLGADTPNLYNLDVAIQNLKRIIDLNGGDFFSQLRNIIDKVQKTDQAENSIAKTYGSYKATSIFLLNNRQFYQNQRYGIFAGIPLNVSQNLTLVIDEDNPTYHSILSVALLIVVIQIQNNSDSTPIKGLQSLCENIRYLVNDQSSKEEVEKLIQAYINFTRKTGNTVSILGLIVYLDEIKASFRKETDLKKQAMDLLRKVINESALLEEFVRINVKKPPIETCDVGRKKSNSELQFEEPTPDPSTQVFKKPNPEEADEELSKAKSNPFLRTVGTNESEFSAQGLLNVNDSLLKYEIHILEDFIFDDSQNDANLESLKLVWSLVLYYSIPLSAIDYILVGAPEIDYSRDEYLWHIVIDLTHDVVMLPTPVQKLNSGSDDLVYHKHLSLPLESKIKSRLKNIGENQTAFQLRSLLPEDIIEQAKSFKHLDDFRQYRMTAGKVSRVLSGYVFWHSQDQVKTAYLQGGSYTFIHMGCYYTQFYTNELVELYKYVSDSIFKHHQLSEVSIPNRPIGSLKKPSQEDVRKFLELKNALLVELGKTIKTNEQLWDYHNKLALYTLTVLCIETTHRPHYDPFYSVNNFINQNLVQVTEKEVMTGFEGRLALIEESAAEQVKNYLKHLEYWSKALSAQSIKNESDTLNQLITGTMSLPTGIPLFFLIIDGELRSISEKMFDDYFNSEEGLSLESNFFRHFFSSEMCRFKAPRIHTSDQMGHNSKGLELGVQSRFNSVLEEKQKLLSYLQRLARSLDLKPAPLVPFARYQCLTLKAFKVTKKLLGPFRRAHNRKVELTLEEIDTIDQILASKTFSPESEKLYISVKLQNFHLSKLKEHYFQKSSKVLKRYYLSKKSTLRWIIEQSSSLAKSPYGKRYGLDFYEGQKSLSKIHDLVISVLDGTKKFDINEKRVLLSLTAIASGQIKRNEHILEILNMGFSQTTDIKFSRVLELTASDAHKLWILNSSSFVILKLINEPASTPINLDCVEHFLSRFGLPKLAHLKRAINAFLTLYRPNSLSYFIGDKESQSSIDLQGVFKLFGNFSEVNRQPFASPNFGSFQIYESKKVNSGSRNHSEFAKSINSLLREAKDNKLGHARTLTEIEALGSNESLNTAEILLLDWAKLALTEKRYAVSTISKYFQDTYKFICRYFSSISLDDLDEEFLFEDLYPEILHEMELYYEQKNSVVPTSALASFHSSLESLRGIDSIKFVSGTKIKFSSLQNQFITEDEYQACQQVIINSTLGESEKQHLSLTLLLYRRLGLRKSEVFKIKIKDICLSSKTIHVHGIKYDRQKSVLGNRLLPYESLLKENEIKQLEEFVQNQSLEQNSQKRWLVFHEKIEIYSKRVVTQKVTAYVQFILQSVTANPKVTVKSLRKTFASEMFLNLTMNENFGGMLKKFRINRLNLNTEVQQAFNQKNPFNLYWLLASWMGHSTPETTFKYYIITHEIVIFLWSEQILQKEPRYLSMLKFLSSEQGLKESAFKNLNRTKPYKYATFFYKFLTSFTAENLLPRRVEIPHLFDVGFETEKLDKILTLYRSGLSAEIIEKKLSLSPSTALSVIQKSRFLVSQNGSISDELFFSYLSRLSRFEFGEGKLVPIRTSRIFEKTSKKMAILSHEDKGFLKGLWQKQFAETFVDTSRFRISSENELIEFLTIYKKIQLHHDFGGHLLIEVNGFRTQNCREFQLNSQDDYIKFADCREVSKIRPPLLEGFDIYLSARGINAKKTAKLHLALNVMIFLTLLKNDMNN